MFLAVRRMAGCWFVGCLLATSTFSLAQDGGNRISLTNIRIMPLAEPTIYATETGLLEMAPSVGQHVEEGEVIARIDDDIAQQQLRVKYYEYQAEKTKLDSEIEVTYAEKRSQVAEASYLDAKDANDKVNGAISPNELRRRLFEWESGKLSIEKAINERRITRSAAEVKLAEFDLAKKMLERYEIKSVVTGVVEMQERHAGEWVKTGDPICKLTQRNRLKIVGEVKLHDCAPSMLIGKQVTLTLPTIFDRQGATQTRQVESLVTHVGSRVDMDNAFEVHAEFDNPDETIWIGDLPGAEMILDRPVN